MAVWIARPGIKGQFQDLALEQNLALVGGDDIGDLSKFKSRDELGQAMGKARPDAKPGAIINWRTQLWAFYEEIKNGDIVLLPLKGQNAVALGMVSGNYQWRPDMPEGARHSRPVDWKITDAPRDRFGQDILYSIGAFMTVCRIKRNNAEERIKAVMKGGDDPGFDVATPQNNDFENDLDRINLEDYSLTQIRSEIGRNFQGHKLAELVDAILKTQGYKTILSPPGPDGGVDIQAGSGPMGFDHPRILVQVKSGGQQADVKVLRELQGVMGNFGAEYGLLVSWSGFKRSVYSEARRQFFQIRLWDAGDVVEAVLKHYDKLPEDFTAELPLKKIWIMVSEEA